MKVASGSLPHLNIFGDDYETRDGTGERDYIHVMDLAAGHMSALSLYGKTEGGYQAINLGTGRSISVLEIISAFEKVSGQEIKKVSTKKRLGDLPVYYAQIDKAKNILKWQAHHSLFDMCESSWAFEKNSQK